MPHDSTSVLEVMPESNGPNATAATGPFKKRRGAHPERSASCESV